MATAAVGKLWVGLDMKTKGFEAGLKKGVAQSKEASKKMGSAFASTFAGVFTGQAAFAGVQKFVSFGINQFKKFFDFIKNQAKKVFEEFGKVDELAKLSRELDININNLVAFRRAATNAGSSAAEFDKGLRNMNKQIALASVKGSALEKELAAMGLNAKELGESNMDRKLILIADAIKNAGSEAQKVAALSTLFGTKGTKLKELFEGGAAGLRQATIDAAALGIKLDGSADSLESFNDMLSDAKEGVVFLRRNIAINIAPTLIELMKSINSVFNQIFGTQGDLKGTVDLIGSAMVLWLGQLRVTIGFIQGVVSFIARGVAEIGAALERLTGRELLDEDAIRKFAKDTWDAASKGTKEAFQEIGDVLSGEFQRRLDESRLGAAKTGLAGGLDVGRGIGRGIAEVFDVSGVTQAEKKGDPFGAGGKAPTASAASALVKGSAEAYSAIVADQLAADMDAKGVEEQIVDGIVDTNAILDGITIVQKKLLTAAEVTAKASEQKFTTVTIGG